MLTIKKFSSFETQVYFEGENVIRKILLKNIEIYFIFE